MALDNLELISEHACFGGVQRFYKYSSAEIGLPTRFGLFLPPQALAGQAVPLLTYLAGLTCNEETFAIKAGAQRQAAELGLAILTPDTSPRGAGIVGEDHHWEFGVGAGFYLDATEMPWAGHWCMESYIVKELLPGVLGQDESTWAAHDASALMSQQTSAPYANGLLIDQGLADKFLVEQLKPELFEAACAQAGQPLTLRRHAGYDHGYYFIQSFVGDHLRHHAERLA